MKQQETNYNPAKSEKQELEFKVLERAIIYARVSTDEQAETGTSLDNQVEKSLAYAEANNMHVVGVFREDYTGKILERPELSKVRAMFKNGQADSLIVYKTNRLDRSEWGVNLLILLQELKSLGAGLHYSESRRQIDLSNPVEALMQSISGWQAGEDHRETVTKLYEGKVNKAKNGNAMGSDWTPYGYKIHRWKEGKQNRRTLTPIEAEARIVKLIFQWYCVGDETGQRLPIRNIAHKLDRLNIPTRSAGRWVASTVSHILKNQTYIGTWHYAKRSKRGTEPIAVEVEPIIEPELFQAAKKQLEHNITYSKRNRKKDRYLLSHRVRCGDCGYKMTGKFAPKGRYTYTYYLCPANSRNGRYRECNLPYFNAGKVDNAVWQYLTDIAHNPDKLEKGLNGYQAATQAKASPIKEELQHVLVLIDEHTQEWEEENANLEAVSSKRSKARFALRIEQIEAVLDGLEARKAELEAQLDQKSITDEEIIQIKQFFAMIAQDWERISKDFDSKQALIAWLDIQARLVVEDGQQVVYIRGRVLADEKRLPLEYNVSCNVVLNRQTEFVIEARLVIN